MDKNKIENIYLFLFFGIMLWLGLAGLWGNSLIHDYPVGYLASDNYLHYHIAENIFEEGGYKYGSLSLSGGYPDVIGHYYAVAGHLSAVITTISGIPTYDSLLLLIIICGVLCSLMIYFIIKRYNEKVAILSLPIATFLFAYNFYFIFLWGQYEMILATTFAILSLWAFDNIDKKWGPVALTISLSAAFLTHTAEFLVMVGCLLTYSFLKLVLQKDFTKIKKLVIAIILSLAMVFNYVIIFLKVIIAQQGNQPFMNLASPTKDYLRTAVISNFGYFLIILAVGLVYYLISRKYFNLALFVSLFYLVWGFLNMLGGTAGSRSIPQRFFWPVYFMPFFGYGVYFIVSKFKKKNDLLIYIVSGLLIVASVAYYHQPSQPGSLYGEDYNQLFKWIKGNTEKNSTVLFVFDNFYPQSSTLFDTFRINYFIDQNEYIDSLKSGMFKREYKIYLTGESTFRFPYRESLTSFKFHFKSNEEILKTRDICSFDYIVFSRRAEINPINQFNGLFESILLNNTQISRPYSNMNIDVLKNNDKKDCLNMDGVKIAQ